MNAEMFTKCTTEAIRYGIRFINISQIGYIIDNTLDLKMFMLISWIKLLRITVKLCTIQLM